MNINEALNILNLKGKVTKLDIAKSYKKLAIKYHPDRSDSTAEIMKNINVAYDVLKNIDAQELELLNKTKSPLLNIVNYAYDFLNSLDLDVIEHTDEKNAYDYIKELEKVLFNVYKIDNITVEICGNWIWLSGETKINKDQIKSLGFKWSKNKTQWYYRPNEHKCRKKSNKVLEMDKIREIYGSTLVNLNNANNKNVYRLECN